MSLPTVSNKADENKAGMDGAVIRLDSVSVRYRVPEERYGTFKEYIIRRVQGKVKDRDFWALHDVDLEVRQGEVFGVIGRNGAGKSTMLKVVSRVLRPTKGRVRVIGRVAPLLELGAAFHHELTGRENIFLNAALLGHTQREVEERFHEIVDFADISRFIDAPLRTYSTGMVARLGFSVATAWEPDILVLDEVLAVGDEAFQEKCHERIRSFRENGATVLLVSHNTRVVREICQRVAWIDRGVLQAVGGPEEIVQRYREG
jgi:ABC-type polysaccharide/polyol phosphate transport system ATPase subunit